MMQLLFWIINLFSFSMQHFHQERLCWCTTRAMLHVQMFLALRCQRMNIGNYAQQFGEFLLFDWILVEKVSVCIIERWKRVNTHINRWITRECIVKQSCLHIFVSFHHGFSVADSAHICAICNNHIIQLDSNSRIKKRHMHSEE